MDRTKKLSMQALSVICVIGGLVLVGYFFGVGVLDGFKEFGPLVQALIGVLAVAYGLIGFKWYAKD